MQKISHIDVAACRRPVLLTKKGPCRCMGLLIKNEREKVLWAFIFILIIKWLPVGFAFWCRGDPVNRKVGAVEFFFVGKP